MYELSVHDCAENCAIVVDFITNEHNLFFRYSSSNIVIERFLLSIKYGSQPARTEVFFFNKHELILEITGYSLYRM